MRPTCTEMEIMLLPFVVLLALIPDTFGAVSLAPLKIDIQYGKEVLYCAYGGMKLLPGSKIHRLDGCEKCVCSKTSGLHCMTTVPYMKVIGESECKHVSVKCKGRWVRKSNEERRCPKKLIPKLIEGKGK